MHNSLTKYFIFY